MIDLLRRATVVGRSGGKRRTSSPLQDLRARPARARQAQRLFANGETVFRAEYSVLTEVRCVSAASMAASCGLGERPWFGADTRSLWRWERLPMTAKRYDDFCATS